MKIVNHKATFDYQILDRYEAGVELLGLEVKSLREGHAKLEGSFVKLIGSGAFLVNAQIFPYLYARPEKYDPKRTRRLLLHKKELISLRSKIDGANLTLIPLSWYNKGSHIKLEIGLARGKKQYEKRDKMRKAAEIRDLERGFRGKIK